MADDRWQFASQQTVTAGEALAAATSALRDLGAEQLADRTHALATQLAEVYIELGAAWDAAGADQAKN